MYGWRGKFSSRWQVCFATWVERGGSGRESASLNSESQEESGEFHLFGLSHFTGVEGGGRNEDSVCSWTADFTNGAGALQMPDSAITTHPCSHT